MMHKVLCYQSQTLGCRQQVHFLGKLPFQLGQLRSIQVTSQFQCSRYLIVDFRILQILQFLATILIVEWYCCLVLYGPFEVVDTHVATECTGGDVIVREQRCSCKANTVSRWQQMH